MTAKTRALKLIDPILEGHIRDRFIFRSGFIAGIFILPFFFFSSSWILTKVIFCIAWILCAVYLFLLHLARRKCSALADAVECWYSFRQQLISEGGFKNFVRKVSQTEEGTVDESELGRTVQAVMYRDRFRAYKRAQKPARPRVCVCLDS